VVRTDIVVFWIRTSCSLIEVHIRFGGTYCVSPQGRRIMQYLIDYKLSEVKRSRIYVEWLSKSLSVFTGLQKNLR
jgi:hypothetical protein